MKKSLTNADIITIIKTLKDKDSFLNNIAIKLPYRIMWTLKINLKLLSERLDLIAETENEIYQECIKPEYLELDNDKTGQNIQKIKPEYMEPLLNEVNAKLKILSAQKNDLNIQTISENNLEAFLQKYDEQISLPEFTALEFFIEHDKIDQNKEN